MRLTTKLTLVLVCAGFAGTLPAMAESLRCGSALIQPGDDARYVLEQCGEPVSEAVSNEAAPESAMNVYHIGLVRADRWLYHRGPGLFPAIVTIAADGRVADIQFERVRD